MSLLKRTCLQVLDLGHPIIAIHPRTSHIQAEAL